MIDAVAAEPHFVDHLAPVWHALPLDARGTFYVPMHLEGHARARGVDPTRVDVTWPQMPGDRRTLVASWGDTKRARRAGRTRIAYLEHGAGQSYGGDVHTARHESYAGGDGHADVGLFLVPNDHAGGRWQAAYPAARVEIIGSPVLDTLPERDPGPPLVAIGFHWDCRISRETTSAIHDFGRILGRLGLTFPGMIGTGHPRRRELPARYRMAGIEHVADWREVCRRASLYVCDNSSTLFEFAALDRPVVVLNARRYRRDVEHGLRFWDAVPGPMVDRPEDLAEAIALALTDPVDQRANRHAAIAKVYQPLRGGSELAAAALLSWA